MLDMIVRIADLGTTAEYQWIGGILNEELIFFQRIHRQYWNGRRGF